MLRCNIRLNMEIYAYAAKNPKPRPLRLSQRRQSIKETDVKIALAMMPDTALYPVRAPHKQCGVVAMSDTVITITISVALSLAAIRLGIELWLDNSHYS